MDEQAELDVSTDVQYVCPHCPEMRVHVGQVEYQAVNGVLTLPKAVAAEFEEVMMSRKNPRPDLRQNCIKIDHEAAKRAIEAHKASLKPLAAKGAMGSQHDASHLMREQQTDVALAGSNAPLVPALKDDGPEAQPKVPVLNPPPKKASIFSASKK